MYILGIDTSAVTASVAVCDAENGIIRNHAVFSIKNGMTHSENLLPLVDSALHAMNVTVAELGLIAVSAGPGSFTGVRIGVATVKGLACPNNIPVCAVSTLEALARNAELSGLTVCPVMDARRGQFYTALFRDGKRLTADSCLGFDEIYSAASAEGNTVLCGDGAVLFASLCPDNTAFSVAPLCARDQNALSVASVGYDMLLDGKATTHSLLRPVYLRASQAEREAAERKIADKK